MGAAVALVMLGFMLKMYPSKSINAGIAVLAVATFAVSLWLVRSQRTVDDVAYMKAMVPHHSIAILTSSRAQIRDPRVRKLADGIIETQVREIREMQQLLSALRDQPSGARCGQHSRLSSISAWAGTMSGSCSAS